MKQIGMLLALFCLVFAVQAALGGEPMEVKSGPDNPDSLINYLDPGNAPAPVIPAHRGLMGLNEEGLPGVKGSAAGGIREVRDRQDTFLNYLHPTNEQGASIQN